MGKCARLCQNIRGQSAKDRFVDGDDILLHTPLGAPPTNSGSTFEGLLAFYKPHLWPLEIWPPNDPSSFKWRADFAVGPGISVIRAQYGSPWSFGLDKDSGTLNLGFVTSGTAEMQIGSRVVERTPCNAVLYAQPTSRKQSIYPANGIYASALIRFEAGMVAKVLADLLHGPVLTKLDLAPVVDLSTGFGQSLVFLLAHSSV